MVSWPLAVRSLPLEAVQRLLSFFYGVERLAGMPSSPRMNCCFQGNREENQEREHNSELEGDKFFLNIFNYVQTLIDF